MLERTAASIEPCGLHRVLPSSSSKYSLKGQRRLHTGFWQNAAPDVELLDACSVLMRMSTQASLGAVLPTKPENKLEASLASTFVLDFLYPNWAAPSLRRLRATLGTLRPFDGEQKACALTTRLYSSSSDPKSVDSPPGDIPDSPPPTVPAPEADILDGSEVAGDGGKDATQPENISTRSDIPPESGEVITEDGFLDAFAQPYTTDHSDPSGPDKAPKSGEVITEDGFLDGFAQSCKTGYSDPSGAKKPPKSGEAITEDEFLNEFAQSYKSGEVITEDKSPNASADYRGLSGVHGLQQILTSQDDIRPYETVWSLYSDLDDTHKQELRTDVVLYLSRSARPVEAWRVVELFSLYSIKEWTDDLVEAVVKARLMFQDVETAKAVFTIALEKRQLGKALDPFVVYCFRKEDWELFFEVCDLFEEHMPPFQKEKLHYKKTTRALDTPEAPEPDDSTLGAGTNESVSPSVRAFIFDALAAFPEFEDSFRKLWIYAGDMEREAKEQNKNLLLKAKVRRFLRRVAARSLPFFSLTGASRVVKYSMDPMAYDTMILLCIERGWPKLATETYRRYGKLSKSHVSCIAMQLMINVFFEQRDALEMQRLLEDWTSSKYTINLKSYQKFIAFYARQGDVATVQRLVKDYLKQHKWAKMDPSVISALIQVHAASGDCDAARRVLEEYAVSSAVQPNTIHWNNLIQAYAKARDFEGAMGTFMRLCEVNQPDQYSFGIVMGLAGTRGDLPLALDLLRISGELGVKPNTAMMDTLVEAYCQNDRFEEASLLCARTAKQKAIEGNRTCLWNTLLHHHARRRDLSSVNRVLEYMTKNKVPYDEQTYSRLIQALVNCRQVHHALHFLRVALRDGVFQPTDEHYVMIMSGFIQTGEGYLALKTNELIKDKFPDTTSRMTAIIQALGKTKIGLHSAALKLGNDRLQYVNRALWLFRESFGKESSQSKGHHRDAAQQYSQVLLILIQLRDFASVREILSLYSLQFPARASQETMPIKLLLDMMLADFYERKYARVKQVFNIILTRLERAGKQSSALHLSARDDQDPGAQPRLAPAFQYELCDALKTMQRLFEATDDAQGLIDMVEDVRRRGFKLDGKNWNIYVQTLARMNRWQQAFQVCEKELMPNWLGWSRRPIELHRLASNPRIAQPISYTMLTLTRVWMDLDKLKLWSPEAQKMIQTIRQTCPVTLRAISKISYRGKRLLSKKRDSLLKAPTPEERDLAGREELRRLSRSEFPRKTIASADMEALSRLARAELEQEEVEISGDAFAQDEIDSTPQVSYSKKSIDEVKTPYPWRNTWTSGEGLQMRQSDKPLAPQSLRLIKKHYFRRRRIEEAEKKIQKGVDAETTSPPASSPEESSPVEKVVKRGKREERRPLVRRVRTKLKWAKRERKHLRTLKRLIYGKKNHRGRKKPTPESEPGPIPERVIPNSIARPRDSELPWAATAELSPSEFELQPPEYWEPSRKARAKAKKKAKLQGYEEEAEEVDDAFSELANQVEQSSSGKSTKSRDRDSEDLDW